MRTQIMGRAAVVLLLLLVTLLATEPAFVFGREKALSLKARVTERNVLRLLADYDRDGYFILKHTDPGEAMVYMDGVGITDTLDMAVHEMCHAYTGMGPELRIYRGAGKSIRVRVGKLFRTRRMAVAIPKRLRTFRYKTYVGKPEQDLASDVEGVYGLLNEFNAYSWGMHNTAALYRYYSRFQPSEENWQNYIDLGASDRLAYAEFRYYILFYLEYAQKHAPAVYEDVVNNQAFCRAYRVTEKRFAKDIRKYESGLKALAKMLRKKGYTVKSGEYFMIIQPDGKGTGYGLFSADYRKLCKEMGKGKYRKIHEKLMG